LTFFSGIAARRSPTRRPGAMLIRMMKKAGYRPNMLRR
jgi:hypothetical protein